MIIPVELVQDVIEQVALSAETGKDGRASKADLIALLRCSKTLYDAALPLVYRDVGEDQFANPLFCRTIHHTPALGLYVKQLGWRIDVDVFTSQYYSGISTSQHNQALVKSISTLRLLQELEHLSVVINFVNRDIDISDLAFDVAFFPTSELLSTLSLPRLRHLSVQEMRDSRDDAFRGSILRMPDPCPMLYWFRSTCSLTTLSLSSENFKRKFSSLSPWPGIKRMHFVVSGATTEDSIRIGDWLRTLGDLDEMSFTSADFELETVVWLAFDNLPMTGLTTLHLLDIRPIIGEHETFAFLFPLVKDFRLKMTRTAEGNDLSIIIDTLFPPTAPCPSLQRFEWVVQISYLELIMPPNGPKLRLLEGFRSQQTFPALHFLSFCCQLDSVQDWEAWMGPGYPLSWTDMHSIIEDDVRALVARCPDSRKFQLHFFKNTAVDSSPIRGAVCVGQSEVERIHWPAEDRAREGSGFRDEGE